MAVGETRANGHRTTTPGTSLSRPSAEGSPVRSSMAVGADRRFRTLLVERSPDAWQLLSRLSSVSSVAALPFGLGLPV
jgi:hypothetical protein